MNRLVVIAAAVVAGFAATAPLVRAGQAPATPPPAAQTPPASLTIDAQLRSQYGSVRSALTRTADKMPEDAYAFRPVPEVRTFAAAVAHAAATNFGMCANLTGKPNPMAGVDLEKTLTSKTDVVKALNDSFAFCDPYVNQLTPQSMAETYKATSIRDGQRSSIDVARGGLLGNLIAHNNEMYGYLAVYLRLKGIVPPSSDRGSRGRGGDAPRSY
jgi:hypothetical protein